MKLSMPKALFCLFAGCLALFANVSTAMASGTPLITVLSSSIPHAAFFGISFDAGRGVAVGAGGAIAVSADAGRTWKPVKDDLTDLALLAVDTRGSHTVVVGQAGLIMIEKKPGQWAKVDSGVVNRFFSVSVNSNGFAAAVGEFGTVLKSTDGGQTWSSMAPNWSSYSDANAPGTGEPNIYAVYVAESGEITLSGEFGVILRSSDGGATWRVLRPVTPGAPTIFALYFPRDGQGNSYAVGQTGELLISADNGTNWTKTPTNTISNFLGVAAAANGQVVITGMRVMMRSVNKGVSWSPVEEDDTLTDWYQAVRNEATTDRIVAVGHSGRIIQIGGATASLPSSSSR